MFIKYIKSIFTQIRSWSDPTLIKIRGYIHIDGQISDNVGNNERSMTNIDLYQQENREINFEARQDLMENSTPSILQSGQKNDQTKDQGGSSVTPLLQSGKEVKVKVDDNIENVNDHYKNVNNEYIEIKFQFRLDKIKNSGEDADPVLRYDRASGAGVIAVFDGLGGSGSTLYHFRTTDGQDYTYTGAYCAAYLANSVVDRFWNENFFNPSRISESILNLEQKLESEFKTVADQYSSYVESGSILRSSLIKRLPTTLAMIVFSVSNNIFNLIPIWLGDSRCYLLDPAKGLRQLSKDDIVSEADPYQNLKSDYPMSGSINADSPIKLNNRIIQTDGRPCIIFTATDGCFHYFKSPMHFEFTILKSLYISETIKEWENNLSNLISNNTADDASMALVGLGWQNFNDIKTEFHSRVNDLYDQYIKPIDDKSKKITRTQEKLQNLIVEEKELLDNLWAKYGESYMNYPKK